MVRKPGWSGLLLVWLCTGACSITRPLPVSSDASSLRAYLEQHPQSNLRVTEHSGRRWWIHRPEVQGDSLVGRIGYDVPVRPVSVSLDSVAELGESRFSWGRTAGLVGGAVLAAGVALVILLDEAEAHPLDP